MHRQLLLYLLLLLPLSACDKDETVAGTEIEHQACEVELLFSPHGLGDAGYNDLVLYGASRAQQEFGFDVKIHNPQTIENGMECFKRWKDSNSHTKRLFVICSNSYEDTLRKMELPHDGNSAVMVYETEKPLPGAISFKIETYGAAFCVGQLASKVSPSAVIIQANNKDLTTKSIAEGFAEGFRTENDVIVPTFYLSQTSGEGYSMADDAYKIAVQLYQEYDFIFPIAGKSNQGVYKFTRENDYGRGAYAAGIDGDMAAYSNKIVCSLIKRMDKVMYDYIELWMTSPADMPKYKRYMMPDGYAEVIISDYFKSSLGETVDEAILSNAIKKEEALYAKE